MDVERLHALHLAGSFFVTRAKRGMNARRLYSHTVDRTTGLICEQRIALEGYYSHQGYPEPLRRVRFRDPKSGKALVSLTNNMTLPALTICPPYKNQIWIAISTYVLIAIVKTRLQLEASLYTLLQILSVTLFEKMPINKAFLCTRYTTVSDRIDNQLNLP